MGRVLFLLVSSGRVAPPRARDIPTLSGPCQDRSAFSRLSNCARITTPSMLAPSSRARSPERGVFCNASSNIAERDYQIERNAKFEQGLVS